MSVKEYLFQKASVNRIPLSGTFELSPVCNFECKMCYVRKTKEDLRRENKREYTIDEWVKLAEQCREMGMLYLLLTGGEPFLYPDFPKLYEKLHSMGFLISINSNASLIDEEKVEWLKKFTPTKINITLYGASEKTYEKICGNRNAYHKVVKAILLLKEAGISVVLNASMIPENADDMEEIIEFGKKHKIPVRMGTYMFPPVRRIAENSDSRFSPKQAGVMNVMKQYYSLDRETFAKEGKHVLTSLGIQNEEESMWGYEQETMFCRAGKTTFWVSWEGKMTACGIMDFPTVQYPFENNFEKCWMELTEQVRTKTVLKGCKGCAKKKICRPCAAIVHAETGDVNKKAPYLCEMTDATIECWKNMLKNVRE